MFVFTPSERCLPQSVLKFKITIVFIGNLSWWGALESCLLNIDVYSSSLNCKVMIKQIFISVIEILGLFCKSVMRWSISFPQELPLCGSPPKQGNKTSNPNHPGQPFSLPEESKQKVHCSFWIRLAYVLVCKMYCWQS